ncbi:MAG: RNA methyltransferase [Promethearchaeota archaeon]|nr:MAG: RNA methyltransferase [Candidatus Lokiarchaeota archaeon]
MKNFNLLVSSSRYNETNAKAELWFTLLICGDKYPIILDLEFSGLITALTSLNAKDVIQKIKNILNSDPNFFQYILKIIPIDFVCETKVNVIKQIIQQNYNSFIDKNDTFRISLKRRNHESIKRNNFIDIIAENINNKVDLENPNKIINIEILGNSCGITFLKPNDILKFKCKTSLD